MSVSETENVMTENKNDKYLKRKALDMFTPELAIEIRLRIDNERQDNNKFEGGYESVLSLYQGDKLFDRLGVGKVEGLPSVTWNGMNTFIFRQNPTAEFSYTTSDLLGGQTIRPGIMETNGGSIPAILRGLSKYSSWGYAPAFIIHDWLFQARAYGHPDGEKWTFEQSAEVMAEIMKTLMVEGFTDADGTHQTLPKAEDVLYSMFWAVNSSIARRLWDDALSAASARTSHYAI